MRRLQGYGQWAPVCFPENTNKLSTKRGPYREGEQRASALGLQLYAALVTLRKSYELTELTEGKRKNETGCVFLVTISVAIILVGRVYSANTYQFQRRHEVVSELSEPMNGAKRIQVLRSE